MTTASVLKEGMTFGELALTTNHPRAATIMSNTPCHFAVMNIEDYKKCLLTLTKRRLLLVLDFLGSLPFLGPNFTKGHLVKLHYALERRPFIRN
jgi:hypothetical protein